MRVYVNLRNDNLVWIYGNPGCNSWHQKMKNRTSTQLLKRARDPYKMWWSI